MTIAAAAAIRWHLSIGSLVPAACVTIALAGWSIWSFQSTGHWTTFANISSYDGVNLYKANNEYVAQLYPQVHLDVLDYIGTTRVPSGLDEWEANTHFRVQAFDWLIDSPQQLVRTVAFKVYVVLLSPVWSGKIYINEEMPLSDALELKRTYEWGISSLVLSTVLLAYKAMLYFR